MGSKKKGGLTKADLVDVVYDRHGALTKTEAAEIVDTIFGTVKSTLGRGRAVRIKNFGVFEVADRAGRMGVNPTNGEKIFIPPHKGLSFRPSTRLKSQVEREKKARAARQARADAEAARTAGRVRRRSKATSSDG